VGVKSAEKKHDIISEWPLMSLIVLQRFTTVKIGLPGIVNCSFYRAAWNADAVLR